MQKYRRVDVLKSNQEGATYRLGKYVLAGLEVIQPVH